MKQKNIYKTTKKITISGSAGYDLADKCDLPFVQEVYATSLLIKQNMPDLNVAIELGGEDAKVIFFDNGIDERMNGSCVAGTGSFIDQMSILLNMSNEELDKASLRANRWFLLVVFDEKMTKKILVNLYNTYNIYKKRYKIA